MDTLRLPAPLYVGRLFGIPIRLDWSWMPMIPLYAWAIAGVYLPNNAPGRSLSEYWTLGVVTAALLVASVLAHELAHALVARSEGLDVEDITLHIFGGMARLSGEPPTPSAEFKIAVVGPGASFAIGIFFLLVDTLVVHGTTELGIGRVLRHLGIVNLLLATFNLLPGFPLDGGHVLRAILWRHSGDPAAAFRKAKAAGRSIGVSLVGVGLYVYFFSEKLIGLWSVSIGALVLLALMTSERGAAVRALSVAGEVARRPAVSIGPHTTIHALVHDVLPEHRQTAFLVTERGLLQGALHLESIRDVARDA